MSSLPTATIRGILEDFFLYFETNRIGQKRKKSLVESKYRNRQQKSISVLNYKSYFDSDEICISIFCSFVSWDRWWQDGPWGEGLGTSKGAGVLQGAVWDVGWVGYAVGLDFLVVLGVT